MSGNRVFQWLVLLILVALTGCSKEEGGGAADFRPNLEVHEAVDISRTGALLEGLPLDLGGSVIVSSAIEFGFMYSESSKPTICFLHLSKRLIVAAALLSPPQPPLKLRNTHQPFRL